MKKLILGIIAVFCLQVGFIVYNAPDTVGDMVSKTADYPVEPLNNATEPLELVDTLPDESDTVLTARSDNPDAFRPVIAQHRGVSTQFERRSVKVVAKAPIFRSTVITIPPQKPVEFSFKNEYAALATPVSSENYDVAVVETRRQEKRSLVSKALPIIKKPYDWLKAVGSKIKDVR